jgi:ATP-dependent DNA ligase
VEAVNHLKVRSCLIDGEVVCCNERGMAAFQMTVTVENGLRAGSLRERYRGAKDLAR